MACCLVERNSDYSTEKFKLKGKVQSKHRFCEITKKTAKREKSMLAGSDMGSVRIADPLHECK